MWKSQKKSQSTLRAHSYVYILSGSKFIKNTKNSQFGFETEGCGRTVLPDTVETFFSRHLSLIKELYLYPQKIFKRFVQLLEAFGGKVIERRKMAGDQWFTWLHFSSLALPGINEQGFLEK